MSDFLYPFVVPGDVPGTGLMSFLAAGFIQSVCLVAWMRNRKVGSK